MSGASTPSPQPARLGAHDADADEDLLAVAAVGALFGLKTGCVYWDINRGLAKPKNVARPLMVRRRFKFTREQTFAYGVALGKDPEKVAELLGIPVPVVAAEPESAVA